MAAPQLPFDDWMVLQQVSDTRPFQAVDDSRESCCGRQRYEQVHVIGHDIGGDHLSVQRVQFLAEELFCHDRYLVDENRATILCRPHKVIGEGADGRSCVSLLHQTTAHARSVSSCLLGDRRLDAGSRP